MFDHHLAIKNVCAWPNLTLMPDGSVIATIYNQPIHGAWEGDVECWASTDQGRTWQKRGAAAVHEPTKNRMNVAAGLARNGDMVVLASGWTNREKPGGGWPERGALLPAVVSRSSDGGRTWRTCGPLPRPDGMTCIIPFGDVTPAADGSLVAAGYACPGDDDTWSNTSNSSYIVRSRDDGETWTDLHLIGADDFNETDILHLGEGRWLAACRTLRAAHVHLFASTDDAHTWHAMQPVTMPSQHPPHLLRLADDRILLTYGNRCTNNFGVDTRISHDNGDTWSAPLRLVTYPDADSGYPSTVQFADGRCLTAYYHGAKAGSSDYHMGVVHWSPPDAARR